MPGPEPHTWTAGTGNFEASSNWNNGVPFFNDWFIDNSGTAELNSQQYLNTGVLGSTSNASGTVSHWSEWLELNVLWDAAPTGQVIISAVTQGGTDACPGLRDCAPSGLIS